ncbi:hypothetical protein [Endozoicomonas sp. ONNA2]|uniref:hypothetical protein n=1 Tax=Endozoicomonas sp. ONNA2 TaxID=2828741 RepID=UPI002147BC5E|nr:hypothetical protein [Endozoicomonas sp. ONNA2]
MLDFKANPNYVPDFSFLLKLDKSLVESTEAFSSPPSISGHSVRILNSPSPDYVRQHVSDQDSAYPVNRLKQYTVAYSSATHFFLNYDFDGIQPGELDRYFGKNETASGELTYTELNPYVSHLLFHRSSCLEPSVNFSQPSSRPAAIINALNKGTQQQVVTETVDLLDPDRPGISEHLLITLTVTHQPTDRRNHRSYYKKNKKTIRAKRHDYYIKNKETIQAKRQGYRAKKKDTIQIRQREYYSKNKVALRAKRQNHRAKNRDAIRDKIHACKAKNKDTIHKKGQDYYKKNKESIRAKQRENCSKK